MKYKRHGLLIILISVFWMLAPGISSTTRAQGNCTKNQIFTAKSCAGDTNSAEEQALVQLVNKYRAANHQPELRLSVSLSMVANRRMLDLKQNMKSLTHSWSNCPYDVKVEKTWPCVAGAPQKLNSGYKGQGYETLYRIATGNATPSLALEAWRKSTLHNSIILNLGMFKDTAWDEVGVAIDGQYAALWFGFPGGGAAAAGDNGTGLGVSFDQTVTGLSKILKINQSSSTVEDSKWQGYSADKTIKLEIYGTRKEINETNLSITAKLEPNGKLSQRNHLAIATLLKNLFPEWAERDAWLEGAVNAISLDRSVSKTKLVRKTAIEIRTKGSNVLMLTVKPESQMGNDDGFD